MIAARRAVFYFGLWLVLAGTDPKGLPFGMPAACLATWASLALLPPAAMPRLLPTLRLAGRTVAETVFAGIDIARRAFHPDLPLRPGLLFHDLQLPPGMARDGFRALASLQPGALPAGLEGANRLAVHVLDTDLPVTRDLAASEELLAKAVRLG